MIWKTIAAVLSLLVPASVALADSVPLIKFDPTITRNFVEPANNKTWGYSFYATTPVTVTHLAWYDTGGDGLSHSHKVGLWKDTSGITQANWFSGYFPNGGSLLASVTVPAGTTAELSGPWRRVPITPVTLGVGGYSVGGQNNSQSTDEMVYKLFGSFGVSYPTYLDDRVLGGSFTFNIGGADGFYAPGTTSGDGWYLAAGAELGATLFLESVPEPNSLMLFAIAAAVFGGSRRRPRHS